jgi:hypothetical protein
MSYLLLIDDGLNQISPILACAEKELYKILSHHLHPIVNKTIVDDGDAFIYIMGIDMTDSTD